MKKAAILFLTFIYLVVASGTVFHFHYCNGKINGISLVDEKIQDECCDEKEINTNECCDEKTTVLKINDTQYFSSSLKTPANIIKVIDANFSQVNSYQNNSLETKTISAGHHPPNVYQNPIYLQYRILII